MELVRASTSGLHSYIDALERGWSPDTLRPEVARQELEQIASDPAGFLALMDDREGKGPPIKLPDGTLAQRLPSYTRWLWDGEFCGNINFRWQHGTPELPPRVLGHIGYTVVPWKRRRGYATRALAMFLDEVRGEGLPYVLVTTNTANVASQRVIEANGGRVIEQFNKPAHFGGHPSLKYRIDLA